MTLNRFEIKTLKELESFAKDIAKKIPKYKFFGLTGELGSGKTQFTKFFVKALGGDEEDVVSPTFTLLNEYITPKYKIYHFDLYRLNTIEELEEIGYRDYFYSEDIVIVEWIDKIPESIPEKKILIDFKVVNNNYREITVSY